MAAALFIEPRTATLLSKRIADYRKFLGWREDYEFKFAPKSQRYNCRIIRKYF
jgi:hypothetical protein